MGGKKNDQTDKSESKYDKPINESQKQVTYAIPNIQMSTNTVDSQLSLDGN